MAVSDWMPVEKFQAEKPDLLSAKAKNRHITTMLVSQESATKSQGGTGMLKTKLPVALVFLVACMTLSGCPGGMNLNGLNSVTIHNQHDEEITILAVTKIGPVPGAEKQIINNLLPSPIPAGGTFTVSSLLDGEYSISMRYNRDGISQSAGSNKQVLEGGKGYDFYFRPNKSLTAVESSCCLWQWLTGE